MASQMAVLITIARMNRVGVDPTTGILARLYDLSRYKMTKILEELTREELVRVVDRPYRPSLRKRNFVATDLGEAIAVLIIEHDDCKQHEEIPF